MIILFMTVIIIIIVITLNNHFHNRYRPPDSAHYHHHHHHMYGYIGGNWVKGEWVPISKKKEKWWEINDIRDDHNSIDDSISDGNDQSDGGGGISMRNVKSRGSSRGNSRSNINRDKGHINKRKDKIIYISDDLIQQTMTDRLLHEQSSSSSLMTDMMTNNVDNNNYNTKNSKNKKKNRRRSNMSSADYNEKPKSSSGVSRSKNHSRGKSFLNEEKGATIGTYAFTMDFM